MSVSVRLSNSFATGSQNVEVFPPPALIWAVLWEKFSSQGLSTFPGLSHQQKVSASCLNNSMVWCLRYGLGFDPLVLLVLLMFETEF